MNDHANDLSAFDLPGSVEMNEEPQHAVRRLKGLGVAPGIAIGPAYIYARKAQDAEHREIPDDEVEEELARFDWAINRSERDLNKIISITREKLGEDSARIFEAQVLMLHDEAVYEAIVDRIRTARCNADFAVQEVMSVHRRRMEAGGNEYLRERADDLLDVQERLITHLRRDKLLSSVEAESLIVAENLTAADVVLFSRHGILGVALDFGGATSHVAIMARALGLPAVMSLHGIVDAVQPGDLLILDGLEGRVIVNPDADTLEAYRRRQERYRRLVQEYKQLAPLPAETLDGHRVLLRANLEFTEELPQLAEFGAEGIGLFRTEMNFLMRGRLDYDEESQYRVYRKIVGAVSPASTTFRVLDLGGDKMLPVAHREHNPFLGWRGVRVLLDRPEVVLPQLRALLRASAHGPLRLLLPMVTALGEVQRFRELIEVAKVALRERGAAFDEATPLGIMVEVPAVAILAERFAESVDFFSLGTNDLTQYTLAVDRGNDLVSDLYEELHPGVLALIKHTIDAGHAAGIPVSLCGEMGASPRATPILVGLGIDEISASPAYLPGVKRVIRAMQLDEAQALAAEALRACSAREVAALVDTWMDEHACGMKHLLDAEPRRSAGAHGEGDGSNPGTPLPPVG